MKLKYLIPLVLLLAGLAFAQTGLMGGSEGIHQQNASTLGQWRFVVGTGGNVTVDPWALSRAGIFYDDGERKKLQHLKLSATGNFFFGMGLTDHLDAGVGLPINYDRSYAKSYFDALTNIRTGDLDFWIKGRAPFLSDSSILGLALQLDLFMPTGFKSIGIRPRHAWFIKGNGDTDPYTASEVVVGATAISSLDFGKYDVPVRFNLGVGFYYANLGSNTMLINTGVDWDVFEWATAFMEFSGEFRVEDNGLPIDFSEDPMLITPGVRLHLPHHIDLAGGIDLSPRMLSVLYDKEKELENVEDFTIGYTDQKGYHKTYGYTPTVTYAFTGLLTWTFGGAEKAPERECPQGLPPAPDSVKIVKTDTIITVDTLQKVDTLVLADTVVVVDTVVKTESYIKVDSIPDADNDGVSDDLDRCPDSPANIVVNRDGCPRDFDGDGVPDYLDMCPNTLPNTGVDSTGCAMDEDHDGVADTRDLCPLTPKNAPVDTTGCPLDSDRDSVPDYLDKCPNTLRGVKVDKKGCPVNKRENLDVLKKGVNFKTGSTALTKPSFKTLDDIYALMLKLQEVNLEIQGHTDNVGKDEANQKLSQGRAQSAVDYLIKKGVAPHRLRAAGYGASKPIADNKTKKGRAQNRRVELVPFYADEEK